jgi:prephenate dehydrogenase
MRIAFLGFGLIAGSIAKALATSTDHGPFTNSTIAAWSPGGQGPQQALREGLIAEAAKDPGSAVDGAQMVILAAPPLACLDLLDRLAGDLGSVLSPNAIVSDVASTKAMIVARAHGHGLRFVGGHPMAGRETIGYAAATADLFEGRPWVVVPPQDAEEDSTRLVEALADACRARPIRMQPQEHDAAVAAISHLPLVLAAALVESVAGSADGARADWERAHLLAASGWRDMTRLARGDPEMGAGILATNSQALTERIRDLRAVLDSWLSEAEVFAAAGGSAGSTIPADAEVPSPSDIEHLRRRFEAASDRLGDQES